MVFMVVVSILLAGFAWRLQRARRQADAVAKLRKIGVFVAYDYQFGLDSTGSVMPKNVAKSPLNERLIHLLGEDFSRLTSVDGANFTLKSQADLDVLWATVGGFQDFATAGLRAGGCSPPPGCRAQDSETSGVVDSVRRQLLLRSPAGKWVDGVAGIHALGIADSRRSVTTSVKLPTVATTVPHWHPRRHPSLE
jgi:hypothetical protein